MDKGGHRPFTAAYNAKGRIQPEPLLAAFAEGGARGQRDLPGALLQGARARTTGRWSPQIAESVAFWAPHIDTGAGDLKL